MLDTELTCHGCGHDWSCTACDCEACASLRPSWDDEYDRRFAEVEQSTKWERLGGPAAEIRADYVRAVAVGESWPDFPEPRPQAVAAAGSWSNAPTAQTGGRWVDLGPYLDGTFEVPEPCVGGVRDDGKVLLYAEKWHTLIAPTETGKSLWAAWHVAAELLAGRTVVYAHFEESGPAGTIARLLRVGVPKDVIRDRFRWADCSTHWQAGEFAASLAAIRGAFPADAKPSDRPTLVILDGINAACGQHQWPVEKTESVTAYRQMFVAPATARGMAVLSLGHPPKARGREDERHGFGSTAWLDEVDGVGFRLLPTKDKRIAKGAAGMAILYTVKDRYGEVSGAGLYRESDAEGWRYMGAFCVDDTGSATRMRLSVPRDEDESQQGGPDPTAKLADDIVTVLRGETDYAYSGVRALESTLRAAKIKFDKKLVSDAIHRLRTTGRLELVQQGQRLGGRLTDAAAQDTPPTD